MTPLDDPYEYDAAWRFSLASYLFSEGVRSKDDFACLKTDGGIMVTTQERSKQLERRKTREGRKKQGKVKNAVSKKGLRPVVLFSEHPEYRSLASDEWVQNMVFMMSEEAAGRQVSEAYSPIKIAKRWYEQNDSEVAMKKRLEPLLLTDADLDVIALDLLGSTQGRSTIEAYERLFFCSRDDNFNLHPSIQRIQKLALPCGTLNLGTGERKEAGAGVAEDGRRSRTKASDLWRVVAANLGYEALITMWGWNGKAHGLKDGSCTDTLKHFKAIINILVYNVIESQCAGTIEPKDVAKMFSSYTALLKLMETTNKTSKEDQDNCDQELMEAFLAVLQAAAPKMHVPREGESGYITDSDIREAIAAQQAINKQPIEDAGEQVSREVIDEQISDNING